MKGLAEEEMVVRALEQVMIVRTRRRRRQEAEEKKRGRKRDKAQVRLTRLQLTVNWRTNETTWRSGQVSQTWQQS